jgi:hypothetical protein
MSMERSSGAYDPMQAAYDFAWAGYEATELGTDYKPDVPENKQVIGNTDLFDLATQRATLDAAESGQAPRAVGESGDGSTMATQERLDVYEPIPVGTQLDAAHKVAAIGLGVKLAVRLSRFVTDVRTTSLNMEGVDTAHDVHTTDVLELVDTAYVPPKVLETFARPEVITTVDDDAPEDAPTDILKREFADPTRPDYDTLRTMLAEQKEYRGVLSSTLQALGYTAADIA